MKYKGYNIGKFTTYPFYESSKGYVWNVCKDGRNVRFDTLREAKEWINNRIATL